MSIRGYWFNVDQTLGSNIVINAFCDAVSKGYLSLIDLQHTETKKEVDSTEVDSMKDAQSIAAIDSTPTKKRAYHKKSTVANTDEVGGEQANLDETSDSGVGDSVNE